MCDSNTYLFATEQSHDGGAGHHTDGDLETKILQPNTTI